MPTRFAPALAITLVLTLLVAGAVLGWLAAGPAELATAGGTGPSTTSPSGVGAPATPAGPIPTASPKPGPAAAAPVRPARLTSGKGPYGSIMGTGSTAIALTFDDGPDPTWTPQVLALLKQYGITATFCLIGRNAAAHPDLVRAIVAGGHTLCNHSWNHSLTLGSRSAAAIRSDLKRTNDAIAAAVPGVPVVYFRQPGGAWTPAEVAVARSIGMAPLHWTVDPRDWTRPPVASLTTLLANGCRDGAVILEHDGGGNRQNTLDALRRLLPVQVKEHVFAALPTGTT